MRQFKVQIKSIDERYTVIAECIRLGYTTNSEFFENIADATWLVAYDDGELADYATAPSSYETLTLEELIKMEKI